MAKGWEYLAALDREGAERLYRKKAKLALLLQGKLEKILDSLLVELDDGDTVFAATRSLECIETMWRVLGLEYVRESERVRLEE